LERWQQSDDEGHPKIKEIKNQIGLCLYNNRHIVLETRNKEKNKIKKQIQSNES
jgi:hypothetical protein